MQETKATRLRARVGIRVGVLHSVHSSWRLTSSDLHSQLLGKIYISVSGYSSRTDGKLVAHGGWM